MRLNIGCGGGSYRFRDYGCTVNIDIEKPSVKIPNFILSDANHLPFRGKVFDCAIISHVVEMHLDASKIVAEAKRVSREIELIYYRVQKVRFYSSRGIMIPAVHKANLYVDETNIHIPFRNIMLKLCFPTRFRKGLLWFSGKLLLQKKIREVNV